MGLLSNQQNPTISLLIPSNLTFELQKEHLLPQITLKNAKICHLTILNIISVMKIKILFPISAFRFPAFFPSDFRKKILISDFRVPTFEPFPISDSSDFRHLWLFRPTSALYVRKRHFCKNNFCYILLPLSPFLH